jgi:periplasmic divalent cation tolerance protein
MTLQPAVAVVLATAASIEDAEALVTAIVEERLAACGNIVPNVVSIYRWEGEVRRESEVMIVFKTERSAVPKLMARVSDLHAYDVPEVLALSVTAGLPSYLMWVAANADG